MLRLMAATVFALAGISASAALEWRMLRDAELGFQVSLPQEIFTSRAADENALHLSDATGEIVLDLYAAENTKQLSPDALADELSRSNRIQEVTYRRSGKGWVVLSGFYAREGYKPGDVVFYTKFVFSSDLSSFAAFEISYPASMKDELDVVVERIEDTFKLS